MTEHNVRKYKILYLALTFFIVLGCLLIDRDEEIKGMCNVSEEYLLVTDKLNKKYNNSSVITVICSATEYGVTVPDIIYDNININSVYLFKVYTTDDGDIVDIDIVIRTNDNN